MPPSHATYRRVDGVLAVPDVPPGRLALLEGHRADSLAVARSRTAVPAASALATAVTVVSTPASARPR